MTKAKKDTPEPEVKEPEVVEYAATAEDLLACIQEAYVLHEHCAFGVLQQADFFAKVKKLYASEGATT